MDTVTLGLFQSQEGAENAINELSRNGFSLRDISIFMKDQKMAKKVCESTGAGTAGDFLEGLRGLGLSEEEVRIYETDIQIGSILLGIPTTDISNTIREILEKHQASQIRSINRNKELKD